MKVSEAYRSIGLPMTNPRNQAWGMADAERVVLTTWREECKGMRVRVWKGDGKPERMVHLTMIREGRPGYVFLATRKSNGEIADVSPVLFRIISLDDKGGEIYANIRRVI